MIRRGEVVGASVSVGCAVGMLSTLNSIRKHLPCKAAWWHRPRSMHSVRGWMDPQVQVSRTHAWIFETHPKQDKIIHKGVNK